MTRKRPNDPDARRVRMVIVCEAAADARTARTLADRVLCEECSRPSHDNLESLREWSGLASQSSHVSWIEVKKEAGRRKIRAHGHFGGEPGAPDAKAARRALLVIKKVVEDVGAVLLIRDSDGDSQRARGLNQARDETKRSFAVVVGVAHTKRECWLLAGFEASDPVEKRRLTLVRKKLGFDPCECSHRLRAKNNSAKTSAKRVLVALCGTERETAERGVKRAPLDTLRQRGKGNGLTAFLGEIEERLLPLFP